MKAIVLLYTLTLCQSLSVHRQISETAASTFDNTQNSIDTTKITDNLKISNLPGDKTTFTKQQTANILLVLLKLGVEPTFGLCEDLDMIKCQQTCCLINKKQINEDLEDGDSSIQANQQSSSDDQNQQLSPKTDKDNIAKMIKQLSQKNKQELDPQKIKRQQRQQMQRVLCQQTNNPNNTICGQQCCLSGYCDVKIQEQNQQKLHLRLVNQICVQNQNATHQNLCKNAGLLWCDGDCCGFLARDHKCFKMNHYGSTFVRCPIEKRKD